MKTTLPPVFVVLWFGCASGSGGQTNNGNNVNNTNNVNNGTDTDTGCDDGLIVGGSTAYSTPYAFIARFQIANGTPCVW